MSSVEKSGQLRRFVKRIFAMCLLGVLSIYGFILFCAFAYDTSLNAFSWFPALVIGTTLVAIIMTLNTTKKER